MVTILSVVRVIRIIRILRIMRIIRVIRVIRVRVPIVPRSYSYQTMATMLRLNKVIRVVILPRCYETMVLLFYTLF